MENLDTGLSATHMADHRMSIPLILGILFVAGIGVTLLLLLVHNQAISLPYDSAHPIIYDNDDTVDVYTDDYLMALASAGEINLAGMITSTSIAPFNKYVPSKYYEQAVADREAGVARARKSGFRNIPDPVRGVKGHLAEPASGRIEDTQPIGSEGSRQIVRQAKRATFDRPLVIVAGGPRASEVETGSVFCSIHSNQCGRTIWS